MARLPQGLLLFSIQDMALQNLSSSTGLTHLDPKDQALFNQYGRGQDVPLPYPTVHSAFLHYAKLYPESTAVIDHGSTPERTLTYAELARHASAVADKLIAVGVKENQRIPLVIHRSLEMIVGILGILMAGAQYIPLDGGVVPDKTLSFIFGGFDDGTPILTTSGLLTRVKWNGSSKRALLLDSIMESIPETEDLFISQSVQSPRGNGDSGCYVIYTSGTTGAPKGVDITHANVVNLVCLSPGNLGIVPGTRVGSMLSVSFDMGAWEILGALCNGATLVLRGSDWEETLHEIDVLVATPSILSRYDPSDYPNIKVVGSAGEQMLQRTADEWTDAGKALFIGCGPTEVTIVNTLGKHVSRTPVCIGCPTPNNTVYVLDENHSPVPFGSQGTLWAGGRGISRGYVALPELTAQRWRSDPFAIDGSMMFNTGDLGYWLADGTLQIIGRQDDQVKVKGFRVELDGVTAILAASSGVSGAATVFHEKQIYAFVTPISCPTQKVIQEAKKTLPYYAIPKFCVAIDEFPQTANGKVDKRALKSLANNLDAHMIDSPTTTIPNPSPFSTKASTIIGSEHAFPEKHVIESVDTTTTDEKPELPVPAKNWPKWARNLRLRILIVYRTIFAIVWLLNVAALVCITTLDADSSVWLGRLAYINLTVAVLIRQDHVVNILYTIACSIPHSWPPFIRLRAAKIYHFGGTHSGFASCAVAWYTASLTLSAWTRVNVRDAVAGSAPWLVLSFLSLGLLYGVAGVAYPRFRKLNHNKFEMIHRFFGWSALILIWISTMLLVRDNKRSWLLKNPGAFTVPSFGAVLAATPEFWMLLAITLSIALSWATLKKVVVDAEILSTHAVRLHFDYTVPVNGSFVRISTRPLLEWHSFAPIPAPKAVNGHPKGFSLIVSNAGDWTKDMIAKPRQKIWVRGVPTCGVMRVAPLFRSLILIGTGSGIGPLLGFIQRPTCPYRLIWSTKDPVRTFGQPLIDEIKKSDPQAVIWDTRERGRPDLVAMAYRERAQFGAEGILIIANEPITKKVVYGLESRGVPAFGAIWDS